MSDVTLEDEELFGEAASEMREDVETHLRNARAALPDPDDVWEVEADNTLGVLNGLRSALAVDEVQEHLRQAKKWYTIGKRADAFEEADDLEAEIQDIQAALDDLEDVSEQVGQLASTIPELRSQLEELQAEAAEEAESE